MVRPQNNNRKNAHSMLFGTQRYLNNRKKECSLCSSESQEIDYKNLALLKKCISDGGRILPRRTTGICAKHQRPLSKAIKRARIMGLLPYSI